MLSAFVSVPGAMPEHDWDDGGSQSPLHGSFDTLWFWLERRSPCFVDACLLYTFTYLFGFLSLRVQFRFLTPYSFVCVTVCTVHRHASPSHRRHARHSIHPVPLWHVIVSRTTVLSSYPASKNRIVTAFNHFLPLT